MQHELEQPELGVDVRPSRARVERAGDAPDAGDQDSYRHQLQHRRALRRVRSAEPEVESRTCEADHEKRQREHGEEQVLDRPAEE